MKNIIIFVMLNIYTMHYKNFNHFPKADVISPNSVDIKPSAVGNDLFEINNNYCGKRNSNWKGGVSKIKGVCKNCQKTFIGTPYKPNVYCSRVCQNRSQAAAKRQKSLINGYKIYIKKGRSKYETKKFYCIVCKTNEVNRKCKYCALCRKRKEEIKVICKNCGRENIKYKGQGKVFCDMKCRNEYSVGENNPHYIDGRTPENSKIRASEEYKQFRKQVLQRDDYTCVFCGQIGGVLHVDHIKQFAFYPELRLNINNGRTLCFNCHKKTDTYLKGRKKSHIKK